MSYTVEKRNANINVSNILKDYIDVPKFITFCKECPKYNKIWSCPEHDFDVIEYWNHYDTAELHLSLINYDSENIMEQCNYDEWKSIIWQASSTEKAKMSEYLLKQEKINDDCVSLSSGSCKICGEENCMKIKSKPCCNPDKMRYSIESLGGDVVKLAKDVFDVELEWMTKENFPDHTILMGGLLFKK